MGNAAEQGKSGPLWALALATVLLSWALFRFGGSTVLLPLFAAVGHAAIAPFVWRFVGRRSALSSVPATILATHTVLWLLLWLHARSMPRTTPDGVRIRGEGLAILLVVHPFVAIALALTALGVAVVVDALARRFARTSA